MSNWYCPECRCPLFLPEQSAVWECDGCESRFSIARVAKQPKEEDPRRPMPLFETPRLLAEIEQILTDALTPKGVS
jgi:hypothetical protein